MTEFKHPTSSQEEATRQAVLVARIIALNALLFVALGVYLTIQSGGAWQGYQFIVLATQGVISSFASAALIRRGRSKLGAWIIFTSILIAPVWAALLVSDLGYVALAYILVTTYFIIRYVMPREAQRVTVVLTALALTISFLAELMAPEWRLESSLMLTVAPILTALLGVVFIAVIARQAWIEGRIRNRIIVTLSVVLIPILLFFTWYNIQAQRQDMEKEFTNKAESVAVSGAATIGHLLEEAIANGDLTTEQVFDTSYVQFWMFDPAAYEFDGDSSTLNKFHTSYDAYTDAKWQNLLDSYLNQEDFVFTIPVDKNGYLPTHNTRWSSWDGSPATDRSKRIFNDPVGLKAAQNTQPTLVQVYPRPGTGETLLDVSAPIYVNGEHWGAFRVGTLLAENNLFAQTSLESATRRSLLVSGLLAAGIIASAWFLARSISKPLEKLTEGASQLATGQFGEVVEVSNITEMKTLANAFNDMTAQLKDLVGSMEQRVADRTKNLATVARISTTTTTIRDPFKMLENMVHLTQRGFDLYHAHVFTYDKDAEELKIVACGYKEGDEHEGTHGTSVIPMDREQSLVARAARTRTPVIVNDVRSDPGWLPNPLLPDTHAELAVPMIVGDELLGVLDVQAEHVDAFTEEDANIQMTLASQVATALQNAQSYDKTQKQAELETLVNVIGQKIQRATSMEDTLQTAIRELGTAIGASRVKASLQPASSAVPTQPVVPAESPVAVVAGAEAAFDAETTPAD